MWIRLHIRCDKRIKLTVPTWVLFSLVLLFHCEVVTSLVNKHLSRAHTLVTVFQDKMNQHHLFVHFQVINSAFSFFFPAYKVVPSRLSPGLSALPLLTWCYRLTSIAETDELKYLCFPFLPHHWCHFAYFHLPGNPSFGSFSSLVAAQGFHHRSETWAFYTCSFVRCVNV